MAKSKALRPGLIMAELKVLELGHIMIESEKSRNRMK